MFVSLEEKLPLLFAPWLPGMRSQSQIRVPDPQATRDASAGLNPEYGQWVLLSPRHIAFWAWGQPSAL